ncbi:MAG: hypothetical protein DI547_05110 [Sphingobium sp.]|nr:MAG: hypothetical protein DI547_05110 [Sphingobium sp.]
MGMAVRTLAEERAFRLYYARVLIREARARRRTSPGFAADLLAWAAKARREACAIDISPAQADLFGGVNP